MGKIISERWRRRQIDRDIALDMKHHQASRSSAAQLIDAWRRKPSGGA